MKKLTTTLIAVFMLSSLGVFAQEVLPSQKELKRISTNSLSNIKSNTFLKAANETTNVLMPAAFYLECGSELILHGVAPFPQEAPNYVDYMTGTNVYGDKEFAQIFELSESNTILSVNATLHKRGEQNARSLYAKVYQLGQDNLPTSLVETSQAVSTSTIPLDLGEGTVVTFNFSNPVTVSGKFAVSIEVPEFEVDSDGNLIGAMVGIYATEQGCYKQGHERYVLSYSILDDGNMGWLTLRDSYTNFADEDCFDLAIFVNLGTEITTDLKSQQENNYTIYPNPATDVIYIENASDSKVRMIDATGKVVLERAIQNSRENIEINHLQKGMYFMEINGQEGKSVNKVIKQ